MNLTRFSLYTSLAIITYLMLLAWQEDYPPMVDDGSSVQSSMPSLTPQIPQGDNPGIGTSVTTASNVPTDVPTDIPSNSGDGNTVSNAVASEPEYSELININTDTLSLSIDLNGGDIVFLALPKFLKQIDVPDGPFVLLDSNAGRSYVAQSGLIGADGIDSNGRAVYQSRSTSYRLSESDNSLNVDLTTTTADGVQITKRFGFTRDSYVVDISFIVNNPNNNPWVANPFGQLIRDNFDDPSSAGGLGRTYLGFVSTSDDDNYIEIEMDEIDDGVESFDKQGGWIGFSQHYFVTAWIPNTESINRFSSRKNNANQYYGEFTGTAFTVDPRTTATHAFRYYAGPKDQYALADISPFLDLTIDYSFLWFIAGPIYWLLSLINSYIGNYGVSIILLTLTVKALFYKLSETQYRSMAGMRRLMPKMQQLKDSYGDDKMKLQKATMELYKKEKINPFGGCLPMLVQMPVFIALYWVLLESVELRHAPFTLWLTDLSVRDPFFILPLLMGATMYLQTSLSPAPADPMQAKVMKLMPVMMTVLFLWFPAGLVLYWLTNGALGILQQWYITRKIEAAYEAKKAS